MAITWQHFSKKCLCYRMYSVLTDEPGFHVTIWSSHSDNSSNEDEFTFFSSVMLSYTQNSLSFFPHAHGPVPSPSQLFAALDQNCCLGSSNTSPSVQCPDLAAFAYTQNAREGWDAVLKSCVSFPTIPTSTANWHLAFDKLSCLHDPLTLAEMQLIIHKHKKEFCKGRKILVLFLSCILAAC